MTGLLTTNLLRRLPSMLQRVCNEGFALCQFALPISVCDELYAEAESCGQWLPSQPSGEVEQRFETQQVLMELPTRHFVTTQNVGRELAQRVAAADWAVDQPWVPNDVAIQRYRPSSGGIGTHRDYARDILLIAVFTIRGIGHMEVIGDPEIQVRQEGIMTTPGSLVLLRGPGLTGRDIDDRPVHRVDPPVITRTSVAYRHNIGL